jgi:hypothetical protein
MKSAFKVILLSFPDMRFGEIAFCTSQCYASGERAMGQNSMNLLNRSRAELNAGHICGQLHDGYFKQGLKYHAERTLLWVDQRLRWRYTTWSVCVSVY